MSRSSSETSVRPVNQSDDECEGYESISLRPARAAAVAPTTWGGGGVRGGANTIDCSRSRSPAPPPPPGMRKSSESGTAGHMTTNWGFRWMKKKDKMTSDNRGYEALRKKEKGEEEEGMYDTLMDPEESISWKEEDEGGGRLRKWKDAADIPKTLKISSLTVGEVSDCLRLLKLKKYAKKFKESDVDGAFLEQMNESILIQSFKMEELEAKKLIMFVKEKWRPSR